jgi:hypothetical protein
MNSYKIVLNFIDVGKSFTNTIFWLFNKNFQSLLFLYCAIYFAICVIESLYRHAYHLSLSRKNQ